MHPKTAESTALSFVSKEKKEKKEKLQKTR
jgi:hypothetical protein